MSRNTALKSYTVMLNVLATCIAVSVSSGGKSRKVDIKPQKVLNVHFPTFLPISGFATSILFTKNLTLIALK